MVLSGLLFLLVVVVIGIDLIGELIVHPQSLDKITMLSSSLIVNKTLMIPRFVTRFVIHMRLKKLRVVSEPYL